MISELAIADIEALQERGLSPSPRDIVRLNALGLLVERAKDAGDIYALPRLAYLGKLTFREPTIGDSMWIERVLSFVNRDDFSTYVAVNAFALSRAPEKRPDAANRDEVRDAIDAFTKEDIAAFTFPQVSCAVTYALHGADQVALEYPEPAADDEKQDDIKTFTDPPRAVGCGLMLESLGLGLGVSVRDLIGMTLSDVRKLISLALMAKGIGRKSDVTRAQADYFRTRDAIEARLIKEKDNGIE